MSIERLKVVALILAVVLLAIAVTHGSEIADWLGSMMLHETSSQLQQILGGM